MAAVELRDGVLGHKGHGADAVADIKVFHTDLLHDLIDTFVLVVEHRDRRVHWARRELQPLGGGGKA